METIETAFFETVRALGQEELNNLVVVGGWCPYLYARHLWQNNAPELKTMDVDFAVKRMTPDLFSEPVYKKLLAANLVPRKMDMEDDNRCQFAFVSGRTLVPVEFITAPNVLPKGQKSIDRPYVACDPVPEVALALKIPPVCLKITYAQSEYDLQVASPAAFVFIKALLLGHRVNARKTPKDLASIAFVLRYHPLREQLLQEVGQLKGDRQAREGADILKKTMAKERQAGFPMLRPFFEAWGFQPARVAESIQYTFAPLLDTLARAGKGKSRGAGVPSKERRAPDDVPADKNI